MWAWQFAKMQDVAQRHGWTRFVSMQNHYNLAYREEEREMIPLCRDQGVGLLPWSPLARGFLAGNRARDPGAEKVGGATSRAQTDEIAQKYYYQESDHKVAAELGKLAQQKGVLNATLAYSWLLHQPGVSAPIVGASKPWQIEQAVQALDIPLSPQEMTELAAPYQPHPVLGHQ
jgi:aryl-alcohol dehydrogenase (NADP+)